MGGPGRGPDFGQGSGRTDVGWAAWQRRCRFIGDGAHWGMDWGSPVSCVNDPAAAAG